MSWIAIALRLDRRIPGELSAYGGTGERLHGPCPVLGKADNAGAAAHGNPARDPLRPYGDLPTGTYEVLGWSPVDPEDVKEVNSYGPAGKLVLDPMAGDALLAKQAGRYGLLIHGGAPAADGTGLRPTYGCARVSNADMAHLAEVSVGDPFIRCVVGEKG